MTKKISKQIEKIKYQASKWCDENIPEQFSEENGYGSAWENKFAELIVKECINIIEQNKNISLNIGNFTDAKSQGIQLGLAFAITDIEEHFGVEE